MIDEKIDVRFAEIENLLYTKHSQIKKSGFGNIVEVLEKLENPHKRIGEVIHITGTNGKGSVAYITESILRNLGYRTALYVSPHINSLTERIQLNGKNITKVEFIKIFEDVYAISRDLSFFEIMTLIAFRYFADKVDYAVIEVGIGGIYDTTNVIENSRLCFITSIDLDHTEMLGKEKIEIARQKSGIIKKNSVCVVGDIDDDSKKAIQEKCSIENAKMVVSRDRFKIIDFDIKNRLMTIESDEDGIKCDINIMGIKQTANLSMVLDGLKEIGVKVDKAVLKTAVSNISINCRFDIIEKYINGVKKRFILDGAHNPQAISIFIENVLFFKITDPVLIFSILSTKDYESVIKKIIDAGIFKNIFISDIDNYKRINPVFIANKISSLDPSIDVSVNSDIEMALKAALDVSDNICVCGSFYLASDAIKIIKEKL
ncbi:MAG: hypothetical protein K6357_08450 [Elusimicrobiota bacterium]